jgi:hypothetical protein
MQAMGLQDDARGSNTRRHLKTSCMPCCGKPPFPLTARAFNKSLVNGQSPPYQSPPWWRGTLNTNNQLPRPSKEVTHASFHPTKSTAFGWQHAGPPL